MLKGPKRSFVVLVVLLVVVVVVGVESSSKNVPNRTKIVKGSKKSPYVAHHGTELLFLSCGLIWPYVTLYGRMWPCMAVCGLVWSCCF